MDLLKKVKNSFSAKKIYYEKENGLGSVIEINIDGFGEGDNYINVEEKKGEELFITLLKRLYHSVLYKDSNWHYFVEGKYNHLRVSEKFLEEVVEILDLHDVQYETPFKEWIDGQEITRKYQDVFKLMFHAFSLMAMQDYHEDEFIAILDRVIHCFMNHQMLFIPGMREALGDMLEPELISRNAYKRAEFISYYKTYHRMKSSYDDWAKSVKQWYINENDRRKEAVEKYQNSSKEAVLGIFDLIEQSFDEEKPITKEEVIELKEMFQYAWDNPEEIAKELENDRSE